MQDFTTKKFLDTAGLTTLWTFISDLFTTKKSVGTHKYIIDASSKDNNLYYPVIMILPDDKVTRIECVVALNSNIPSWSDHEKGFTVRKVWESNGSGWGKATVRRNIYVADYNYATNDPVIKINQLSDKSAEYVYVRGGGKYYFYTTNDVEPVLYDTYRDSSLEILSPISYNSSLKIKVTNLTSDNFEGLKSTWNISINGNAKHAETADTASKASSADEADTAKEAEKSGVSNGLSVIDIRDTSPAPSEFTQKVVSSFFTNTDTPVSNWHSGINVSGWSNYVNWQLSSGAADKLSENPYRLWFRSGVGSTWNDWKELSFSDHSHIGDYFSLTDRSDANVIQCPIVSTQANFAKFRGTHGDSTLIRFINNTNDANGNGILIGDGGAAMIGGGESAAKLHTSLSIKGGDEKMIISNDADIDFYSNCQNADTDFSTVHHMIFGANGKLTIDSNEVLNTNNYSDYALPITGGTLKSSGSDIILKLNSNQTYNAAWVEYNSNDVKLGYLGFNGVDTPAFYPTSGSAKTLIHSGNIGNYALTNDEIDLLWSANISFGSYASAMASSDETINSIGIGDYDE